MSSLPPENGYGLALNNEQLPFLLVGTKYCRTFSRAICAALAGAESVTSSAVVELVAFSCVCNKKNLT
jgi:hypothetical protein